MSAARLAELSPLRARIVLAALALLSAIGLALGSAGNGPHLGKAGEGDAALYRAIAARTAASPTFEGYYAAATDEQRVRGYPLRPVFTVREPTLALLAARLGETGTVELFRLLSMLTLAALVLRLRHDQPAWIVTATLAAMDVALIAQPALAVWHEAWAALLVALSLACRSEKTWVAACLIGLFAALLREFAAAYLLVMAFAALSERRRAEATGWMVALLVFVVALTAHAETVAAHTLPTDLASLGWSSFGGWRFILSMTHDTGAMSPLPLWTSAILVPLALIGWASRASAFTDRVTLTLASWIVAFMFIGRPDNFYWGLMLAPLLLIGLAFAPRALADLSRSAMPVRQLLPA